MRQPDWLIRFDFPEGTIYAGWTQGEHRGSLGWAPTAATAATFLTEEIARRTLVNAYGQETASYGTVVRLKDERNG